MYLLKPSSFPWHPDKSSSCFNYSKNYLLFIMIIITNTHFCQFYCAIPVLSIHPHGRHCRNLAHKVHYAKQLMKTSSVASQESKHFSCLHHFIYSKSSGCWAMWPLVMQRHACNKNGTSITLLGRKNLICAFGPWIWILSKTSDEDS